MPGETGQDKRQANVAVRLEDPDDTTCLVALLEQIAGELGWQPGEQLRADAPHAVHFAAYVEGILAGGLQLVSGQDGQPLPCERVWPDVPLPRREQTAHIAILAVSREHRGTGGLLWPLCIAMWRHCAAQGIAAISLEVTPPTFRLYHRLGWPLEVIGQLRPHWGEDCLLCRMDTTAVAGAMVARAMRSPVYRGIVGMMTQPIIG